MINKLRANERRIKILHYLSANRESTRIELSGKFNVSVNTIARDIDYLTGIAPIYTKSGNNGGVYILPEFKLYGNNLTAKEINCLYNIMDKTDGEDREIIFGIIMKSVNL